MAKRGQRPFKFDYGDLLGDETEVKAEVKEEVKDLMGSRDASMVLGGSNRRRPSLKLGGDDPLEALLKKEPKEPEDNEENAEEFDRAFREAAGLPLGDFASTAPADVGREGRGGEERGFDDLVGEILGESEPVRPRPSLRRSQTAPLAEEGGMRREEPQRERLGRSRSGMPEMSAGGGSEAGFSEGRVQESDRLEGAMEVELIPRPKRSLKAKASPASSRVMTPGLDDDHPGGPGPSGSSTPPRPPRDPAASPPRSRASEGAYSELAHPQPQPSEPSRSSRLTPPPAKVSSKGEQRSQGSLGSVPPRSAASLPDASEGRAAVQNAQVPQASIAALVAEEVKHLPSASEETPRSQRELNFVEAGAGPGFSAMPVANAPDLLLQVAHWKAKAKHLELQLEDNEQRWQRRFEDAKRQEDAGHARMEMQCRFLESELEKWKELRGSDERDFQEQKRRLAQGHRTEQEEAVREERRKVQMELEKAKSDHRAEMEELKQQHQRAIAIIRQQADAEADNLRRAHTGEQHLNKLVEQVQGSAAEVERLSKRVAADKTLEWTVQERQIEARERNAKEMEAQLSRQSREVEEQRRHLSDLVSNLQSCQAEDGSALASERERLKAEHQRLLELQQSVREADRNNKEALKHAWAQVEEERKTLQAEQLRFHSEQARSKEEFETQERHLKSETERLKSLHQQIEVARQSAARRIRETESTVANERRCLMNDLEAFEEKRRFHAGEQMRLEGERRQLQEEKENFTGELQSVGLMAQELERRSEEIRGLHQEAAEARSELQLLRGQLQEERSAQGSEMERLRTMQSLIEQQRLQLIQTENQLRLQGVEDIDLQVTAQGHFPGEWSMPAMANAQEAMTRWAMPEDKTEVAGQAPRAPRLSRTGGDFQIRSKLQRSRKGSGEMQSYLLQSAAFLQEAQRSTPALQVATRVPSATSSEMLEDVGSSQSSSGDI